MAIKIAVFTIVLALVNVAVLNPVAPARHPDVGKNIKELVPKYGYPFEEHTITTKDGYVLELHRIPHGKNNQNDQNKPVVLLQHGMLCSSDSWINTGPKRGLGYILADRGYDVWLGNHRGTTYSRKHVTLDPSKDAKQFWDFSFHEMGVYDNTAFIDYILNETKQDQLYYIGHSQGTTSFFAMASVLPEYNEKIRLMVGLGPVTYTNKLKSPIINRLAPFRKQIWEFMEKRNMYGILKHDRLLTEVIYVLCRDGSYTQRFCVTFLSLIAGFNRPQMDKSILPIIGSSVPAGASWKQFSHYSQGYSTGDFRLYDYGEEENLEKYGQPEPPKYDLGQVIAPVALYYGNNDYLATEKNALRTIKALPNVVYSTRVHNFNHQDFLWGIDVVPLLYDKVLKIMERY